LPKHLASLDLGAMGSFPSHLPASNQLSPDDEKNYLSKVTRMSCMAKSHYNEVAGAF
jgi:hypothetical protein